MKKRVVVTGFGVVHSLGTDVKTFWSEVKAGKNGIKSITKFDTSEFSTKVAAQIDNFDVTLYIDKRSKAYGSLYPICNSSIPGGC